MIPIVQATTFHRFMATGRTAPALCGCENDAGEAFGDFVVKLKGGLNSPETALASELIASRLASYFGIPIPEPALVLIEADFADQVASIQAPKANHVRASVGLNFGSRYLTDTKIWPVEKSVPEASWSIAVTVFAFDALIQNPDRRFSNPNLFVRGDEVFVFDHEMAFSFIYELSPSSEPWRLDNCNYLTDHVFFNRLRREEIDLTEFTARLSELPGPILAAALAEVPSEWKNERLAQIEEHLQVVASQAERFAQEIRRRLA